MSVVEGAGQLAAEALAPGRQPDGEVAVAHGVEALEQLEEDRLLRPAPSGRRSAVRRSRPSPRSPAARWRQPPVRLAAPARFVVVVATFPTPRNLSRAPTRRCPQNAARLPRRAEPKPTGHRLPRTPFGSFVSLYRRRGPARRMRGARRSALHGVAEEVEGRRPPSPVGPSRRGRRGRRARRATRRRRRPSARPPAPRAPRIGGAGGGEVAVGAARRARGPTGRRARGGAGRCRRPRRRGRARRGTGAGTTAARRRRRSATGARRRAPRRTLSAGAGHGGVAGATSRPTRLAGTTSSWAWATVKRPRPPVSERSSAA